MAAAGIGEVGIIVAPETGGEIRGARRRLALRPRDPVHRAGRAARPRPRGAHRRAVPRHVAVRDVPRRQPAARRHRRAGRHLPQRGPRRADPADAGARSGELRRCRAERGRPRRAAGREAEATGDQLGSRRGLHVHCVDLRRRALDRALVAQRARDHRCDPDARRARLRVDPTSCTGGGRTPARFRTCSRRTG